MWGTLEQKARPGTASEQVRGPEWADRPFCCQQVPGEIWPESSTTASAATTQQRGQAVTELYHVDPSQRAGKLALPEKNKVTYPDLRH